MLVLSSLFIAILQVVESSNDWTFKRLTTNIDWNKSPSAEIIFQRINDTLIRCSIECLEYSTCKSIYIYQNTCFGNFYLTEDSVFSTEVDRYVKQPFEVCYHQDFVYIDGICLMVSNVKLEWYEAKSYCENLDGHLVVLDSYIKHNNVVAFIQTYIYYPASGTKAHIGASDIDQEGSWKWVTSNANNFFRFESGQPNNKDTTSGNVVAANCGALSFAKGTLVDDDCLKKKIFICET